MIVDLIEKNVQNEIINIGFGRGYSINELLAIIREMLGDFPIKYVAEREVDVPNLILNIDKLRTFSDINFMGIEEGIKKTYDWLMKGYK